MTTDIEARLELIERHIDWLYRRAGFPSPYAYRPPGGGVAPQPGVSGPGAPSAAVADLVARGRTIEAIKQYREETGVGLKEAKDYVDRLR